LLCAESGDILATDSQSSEKEFLHQVGFEIPNVIYFAPTVAELGHRHGSRLNGGEPPHGAALRIGSRDNSFGLNSVKVIGSPNNQVAKSLEKFSAKNLQILSNIWGF